MSRAGAARIAKGQGLIKIEMQFLPDVYVQCEVCRGTRYNRETLQVHYKGKSISDVLNMTVSEGLAFFENLPRIRRKLDTLGAVGLGLYSNRAAGDDIKRWRSAAHQTESRVIQARHRADVVYSG